MNKRKRGTLRTAELVEIASAEGLRVGRLSRIHLRVWGKQTVDYWPTTGKAWILGSRGKAVRAKPSEVIQMAKEVTLSTEPVNSHEL